ncbi:MAG: hypothetical protein Q8Q09_18425 [Deltaproteobacteria bacterium]|nr:hypothetical protein [Deltaproteobacteria bacterium]
MGTNVTSRVGGRCCGWLWVTRRGAVVHEATSASAMQHERAVKGMSFMGAADSTLPGGLALTAAWMRWTGPCGSIRSLTLCNIAKG